MKFFRNEVILPLLDSGKNIVIVLHSYAGASVGGAIQNLSKQERQNAGLDGGIIGVILQTAMCLPVGLSIQEMLQLPDEMKPWIIVDV